MIRNFMAIPIPDKTTYCIMTDFGNFRQRYYENWDDVLKTIISDKDGVEWHNWIISCFIPKDKYIKDYSTTEIYEIKEFYNNLTKTVLVYQTLDELFECKLEYIYQIN